MACSIGVVPQRATPLTPGSRGEADTSGVAIGGSVAGTAVGSMGAIVVGAAVGATDGTSTVGTLVGNAVGTMGATGTIGTVQAASIPIAMINNEILLNMMIFLSFTIQTPPHGEVGFSNGAAERLRNDRAPRPQRRVEHDDTDRDEHQRPDR